MIGAKEARDLYNQSGAEAAAGLAKIEPMIIEASKAGSFKGLDLRFIGS